MMNDEQAITRSAALNHHPSLIIQHSPAGSSSDRQVLRVTRENAGAARSAICDPEFATAVSSITPAVILANAITPAQVNHRMPTR